VLKKIFLLLWNNKGLVQKSGKFIHAERLPIGSFALDVGQPLQSSKS
jgi:hypothetical protein